MRQDGEICWELGTNALNAFIKHSSYPRNTLLVHFLLSVLGIWKSNRIQVVRSWARVILTANHKSVGRGRFSRGKNTTLRLIILTPSSSSLLDDLSPNDNLKKPSSEEQQELNAPLGPPVYLSVK
ncbi:hypothetical protein VTI74DRAFT_2145 [Chaetomium olivicolor]